MVVASIINNYSQNKCDKIESGKKDLEASLFSLPKYQGRGQQLGCSYSLIFVLKHLLPLDGCGTIRKSN